MPALFFFAPAIELFVPFFFPFPLGHPIFFFGGGLGCWGGGGIGRQFVSTAPSSFLFFFKTRCVLPSLTCVFFSDLDGPSGSGRPADGSPGPTF